LDCQSFQSCHSATNKFVSRPPPLFLLEENMSFLPSFENTGKASNVSLWVTRSNPLPSIPMMYKLKGTPPPDSKFEEKIIRSPSGSNIGLHLASPRLVNCLTSLPSALPIHSTISVGCTKPSLRMLLYSA